MTKRKAAPATIKDALQDVADALELARGIGNADHTARRDALSVKVSEAMAEKSALTQERKTLCEDMRSKDVDTDRLIEIDARLAGLATVETELLTAKRRLIAEIKGNDDRTSAVFKPLDDLYKNIHWLDKQLAMPQTAPDRHDTRQARTNASLQAHSLVDDMQHSLTPFGMWTPDVEKAAKAWAEIVSTLNNHPQEAA
jgi:hypothetical protein